MAKVNGYSDVPEENVASFQPDTGQPILRRRTSISADVVSFTVDMTFTEYAIFRAFLRTTLKDGTLPFVRTRPNTLVLETWRFAATPTAKALQWDLFEVAISMRNVP